MHNSHFNLSRRLIIITTLSTLSAIAQSGCSTQQLYTTGQAWQRNECQRLIDQQDRERCLANAGTSFETYQKQSLPK